jgi:hypothetical protein
MDRFEDMISGLQQDIEVPAEVWTKYTNTLNELPDSHTPKRHTYIPRKIWPVALAATLTVGVISTSAAYLKWSQSLSEGLQATDEQRQLLEENQMASFLGQSVTQNGVTVTAQQSIVDNQYAYLSFRVEGYTLEADQQPGFADTEVVIGDGNDTSFCGSSSGFYDGLITGNDGMAIHTDGTAVSKEDFYRYVQEDGSLEYRILLMNDQKGYFIDQPIHVELKDLGTYPGKAEAVVTDVTGTWSFDWILQGSDEMTTYEMDAPLDDHDATVLEAEISPISFRITYQFTKQEQSESALDENGDEIDITTFAEPPYFTGVQLKDGTIYTGINGGGYEGYSDEDSDTYISSGVFTRIIDVDQIENLLFIRSYPEEDGEATLTEENLYYVPVQNAE